MLECGDVKAPLQQSWFYSANWQVSWPGSCFSLNLLLLAWELSLGKSELEDKCGCTAQLSKAGASLQPTICLGHGLQTLAHSSCGHSCSVGALGKLLRPTGVTVAMAWVCVSPCLARSCWGWTVTAQQAGEIQLEKGWWCGHGFLGRWFP